MTVSPISYHPGESLQNGHELSERSSRLGAGTSAHHDDHSAERLLPTKEKSTSPEIILEHSKSPPPNVNAIQYRTKLKSAFSLRDWIWEFAAMIYSICCAVAIAIVLAKVQDKPLSDWGLSFSPSTFVSILSTASKAFLMVPLASCISQLKWIYFVKSPRSLKDFELFDMASRGPMGALHFLWGAKFRSGIAILGAIITILALAMDSFTQAILVYPSRNVTTGAEALVGASQVYDNHGYSRINGGQSSILDAKMQAAILNGLFSSEPSMSHSCPTSNCTWDPFYTLGVCSDCTDVSKQTTKTCGTDQYGGPECNYTTPAGFALNGSFYPGGSGGSSWTLFTSNASSTWASSGSGSHTNASIIQFAAASVLPSVISRDDLDTNVENWLRNPTVTECELKWCVRKYSNVSVVNGIMDPGTFDSFDLISNRTFACAATETVCPYNASTDGRTFSGNESFAINAADSYYMANYMTSIFTLTERYNYDVPDANLGNALLTSTSIAQTMQNVSASMTYAVGAHYNATPAHGTSYRTETYIKVRWEWFSLPVALIFLGAVFLLCTVVYSSHSGVASWKTISTLPFFVSRDGWSQEDVLVASAKELEKKTERLRAVISTDADGRIFLHKS